MLRVTKLADYAIVMLTHIATHTEDTHNARDISVEVGLPLPMASKVLKRLAREGLLASQRGSKGGYSLARPPREITVADIIGALEGPIAVTECTDKVNGECDLETLCPVRTNWYRINRAIREALDGITLAEMTQPLGQPLVHLSEPEEGRSFRVS